MPVGGCRLRSMKWLEGENFWVVVAWLVFAADIVASKVAGDSWARTGDLVLGEVVVGYTAVGRLVGSNKVGVDMTGCFGEVESCWLGGSWPLLPLCSSCMGISTEWLKRIPQLWHRGLRFSLY